RARCRRAWLRRVRRSAAGDRRRAGAHRRRRGRCRPVRRSSADAGAPAPGIRATFGAGRRSCGVRGRYGASRGALGGRLACSIRGIGGFQGDELGRIDARTLVCVGELDRVTPLAAAKEIVGALPRGVAQLEVIAGAGYFTWLDAPDGFWAVLLD